jgi:hypothetical protein
MVTNGSGSAGGSGTRLEERERELREADRTLERLQAEYERIGSQIDAYYSHRERAATALNAERGLRPRPPSAAIFSRCPSRKRRVGLWPAASEV